MLPRLGAEADVEYVDSSAEEELPELIHEAEDAEEPSTFDDSAEEEMPELITCDEEEQDPDWIGTEEEELPELICQEGDGERDNMHCEILERIGVRRYTTAESLEQNSQNGDVNAMRVVLLGVSDEGTPSVGIDLGLACPAQGDDLEDGESCYTMYNECYGGRQTDMHEDIHVEREAEYSDDGEEIEYETTTAMGGADDGMGSRRMLRLGSPFAFQPPVGPSCSTITFSQSVVPPDKPFLFGLGGLGKGGYLPASQEWQSAVEDQDFVKSVLQCLPGVDAHDPKILERLRKLRIRVAKPDGVPASDSADSMPSEWRGSSAQSRKEKIEEKGKGRAELEADISVSSTSSKRGSATNLTTFTTQDKPTIPRIPQARSTVD